jgi:DNA-binding transcriptional MocR family regulator
MHTIWRPRLDRRAGPLYTALASAIAADVQAGRLRPGDRLPPQRDLADALGVTVTTVTRGYAEAERRGLVRGHVGRGTFVNPPVFAPLQASAAGLVDLATNALLPHAHAGDLTASLAGLVARSSPEHVFNYQPHGGRPEHRTAVAAWLGRHDVPADGRNTMLTSGAQHAMAVAIATLTAPGDAVLCESVTYTGMRSLAHHLHVNAHPVAMDDEGLIPDALEDAALESGARLVYCMPTHQNPTGRVMSMKRRQEVARAAARTNLVIVEDDVYGYLSEGVSPICAIAPDRTFYLTSLSKCLVPGLRVGALRAPAGWIDRLTGAVFATTVMGTPLDAAAAVAWLADGTIDQVIAWKRQEVKARQQIARATLGARITGSASSQHAWLQLPARWPAEDFVREARQRGVLVTPGRDFAVARHDAPNAARICLGPPPERASVRQAVQTLADILDDTPQAFGTAV